MANFGLKQFGAASDSLLTTSADYDAMRPYWDLVDDISEGVQALRAKKSVYLPQFPSEKDENYLYRNKNSVLTDIFGDVVGTLAAKPFTKEAGLYDDAPPANFQALVEDIDRSGDHLHVFAQSVFYNGISHGLDWIMVDHTALPAGATLADERRAGSRPYFVRIPAKDMLWVESAMTSQGEVFTFVKINESYVAEDKTIVERIRVLSRDRLESGEYGPPKYTIYESKDGAEAEIVDEGPITLPVIPLVAFYTGRRIPGTWRFTMPMKPVAVLQIEHYQAQTNLKLAKEQTCFPMLVGQGLSPPKDKNAELMVGPAGVLYAPMTADGKHGEWTWMEPSTESLAFLAKELSTMEGTMRELGRMPLAANSAGITNVAAQMASERSNSAAQSWVFSLKNVMERALGWCGEWMGSDYKPEVRIDTDFAIELTAATEPALLRGMAMPDSGQRPIMSMSTYYNELKRRGIIAPEVNAEKEKALLLEEAAFKQAMVDKYPDANPVSGGTTKVPAQADRRVGEPPIIPDTGKTNGDE